MKTVNTPITRARDDFMNTGIEKYTQIVWIPTKRNAASTQSQILNNNDIGTQKAQNLSMSNK